jgi:hypothetical protein
MAQVVALILAGEKAEYFSRGDWTRNGAGNQKLICPSGMGDEPLFIADESGTTLRAGATAIRGLVFAAIVRRPLTRSIL